MVGTAATREGIGEDFAAAVFAEADLPAVDSLAAADLPVVDFAADLPAADLPAVVDLPAAAVPVEVSRTSSVGSTPTATA